MSPFLLTMFLLLTPFTTCLPLNIWPKPTTFHWPSPQSTPLSPSFTIYSPPNTNRYLTLAINRISHQILTENYHPLIQPNLTITTNSSLPSLTLQITTNLSTPDSYSLTVPCNGEPAFLTAETARGAMHGMETLTQLVYGYKGRLLVGCGVYVHDEPLYGHRGVMLDTSRNFYAVEDLLRLVRGLGMNKMNVFHWHLTDSHSFPLEVDKEMDLAEKGAYGDKMRYTAEDVRNVVHYGMEYGVRVVPEIDMPGEYF